MAVNGDTIKAFIPLVESLAARFTGIGRAEFDDLRQEGLICVWKSLEDRYAPSADLIAKRMIDWTRYLRRHKAISYEEAMESTEGGNPLKGGV